MGQLPKARINHSCELVFCMFNAWFAVSGNPRLRSVRSRLVVLQGLRGDRGDPCRVPEESFRKSGGGV